jgi:hypothetical protein
MTHTYRYKLNEYSHKVFERLFFKFSPVIRRSGKWGDTDQILQSELYSNEGFTSVSVDEIRNELNISDVLMQDVCEYMVLHKHIEVTHRLTTGIIQKIRATKLGFRAYKFETYLEKNKTLVYQHKFKQSAFWNNILTPTIALVALAFAVAGYYKTPVVSARLYLPSESVSPKQETHGNTPQTNQPALKNDTTFSSVNTTKQKS